LIALKPSSFIAIVASVIIISLGPRVASAQEPSLDSVLKRAAAYVTGLKDQLAGGIAEEDYVQDVEKAPGARPVPVPHREIKSDFLLTQVAGARYVDFRDVFEVDGKPVRDRQDRLSKLFATAKATATTAPPPPELEAVVTESARYNIGPVTRSLNTPTLALYFLDPAQQSRFKFRHATASPPALVTGSSRTPASAPLASFTVSADAWVVEFEETSQGTVIKTPNGKDLPSRGRFWIEADTGRVLMTELIVDDPNVRATIDVSYQNATADSGLVAGVLVPREMRERYDVKGTGARVTGAAMYLKFRKFSVQTDTNIDVPPAPDVIIQPPGF
jgi:hypothetical protein